MPGTLIFFHGAGVREAGFARAREKIARNLRPRDVRIEPCAWWEWAGAPTPAQEGERARPRAIASHMTVPVAVSERVRPEVRMWGLLIHDPLLELRALAVTRDDPLRKPPPVDLVVTVGSQGAFLRRADALAHLGPTRRRRPFAPWLNVWDPGDLLSFPVEETFGRGDRVRWIRDEEVSTGVPPPFSHNAYWDNDRLWQVIEERCPARARRRWSRTRAIRDRPHGADRALLAH